MGPLFQSASRVWGVTNLVGLGQEGAPVHTVSDENGVAEREEGRDFELAEGSEGSLRGTHHKAHA